MSEQGAAPEPAGLQVGTAGGGDPRDDSLMQGWKRTSPLGIVAAGLSGAGRAVLPAIAVLFGTRRMDSALLIGALLATAIIGVAFLGTALAWWRLRYRVGSSDILLHRGIVSRSARSVPFERIQDVSLEQGLLPRLLGLVEVRFETGAGGKDELTLSYVTEAEGAALRETVRERLEGAPATGAAVEDKDDTSGTTLLEAPPVFAMGPRRLLVFGAFEFSLVVFAVLAGAAQQFEALLPFDLWDLDWWEAQLGGPGAWLAGLGWFSRAVGLLAALAGLAVLGLATGIARTFAREWDFRLERTARGFRRRRGLFTRTDVVMPVHRVQALTVSTGLLRRRWGWHGLSFISLAQDARSSNHSVAPFARMEEIAPIARQAGFALPAEHLDWHRPSPRYRIDSAILTAAIPLLVAIVPLVLGQVLVASGLFAAAALLALRQLLLWRYERHALDARQVVSRKGWLAPRLKIASRVKLHSVEISQGPVARRRGYADLKFGLAGGTLSFDGLPLAEARRLRGAVMASICAVDFSGIDGNRANTG